jgi:hypothetical protein
MRLLPGVHQIMLLKMRQLGESGDIKFNYKKRYINVLKMSHTLCCIFRTCRAVHRYAFANALLNWTIGQMALNIAKCGG